MEACLPGFSDLAWGAFMYWVSSYGGNIGGDQAYVELFEAQDFLYELRFSPERVTLTAMSEHLIKFLNQWRCQLGDNPQMAGRIREGIAGLTEPLRRFDATTLLSLDMSAHKNLIRQMALRLNDVHGLGPTCMAKILHVLNPAVFVPWDRPIRDVFGQRAHSYWYDDFLECTQRIAQYVTGDFQASSPDDEPEAYLSRKLGYGPPKTLAKFIDEFLWIRVTKGVAVPPPWHPGSESAQSGNSIGD